MTEDRRPMDGFEDIYPWPHHWSREIKGEWIQALVGVTFWWPGVDLWTYENHWQHTSTFNSLNDEDLVDIYWKDDDEERLQLPPPIGDDIVEFMLAEIRPVIRHILWKGRLWDRYPTPGWSTWSGVQGDFVDHIHVEFQSDPGNG